MAFKLNDRVRVTSTTTGTGVFALGSAVDGFETFATGIGGSNTTYYSIVLRNSTEFEVGFGTLDSDGDALTRTYIISSSNSDAAVDFSAGTKDVFCTLPSAKVGLPNPEEYGSSSAPKIINVTVASKSGLHPYQGQGSSNAYYFDGLESPALRLSGVDSSYKYYYRFDQSDSSNGAGGGHPLRFYLEADKSTAYTTGVTTNGSPGSSGAYTQIAVDSETPNILYYQCSSHGYMGNHITTIGNDFNGDANFRGDVAVADNKKITFGAGDDFEILHHATNGNLLNLTTNPLEMHQAGTNSVLQLINDATNHNQVLQIFKGATEHGSISTDTGKLIINGVGALELSDDGSTKLATTASGIQTTGTVNVNGAYTLPTADGSANQILETDGSGAVTFVNKPTAGASAGFVIAMSVAL
jgi:hypothetical protein